MTIKDIAELTGVSRGTVDRVIHDRGKVAPKKRQLVLDAIEKAGFKPNEFASLLASNRSHRIVCLLPSYEEGDIWDVTAGGIRNAAREVLSSGVNVEIVTYDQYDAASFDDICKELLSNPPSGVVVAPMFRLGTMRLVRQLADMGIPYVYIDTKLDDDSYLEFFGLPMYQSGYLGANILLGNRPEEISEILNIRIQRDKNSLSDPTLLRRAGFLDYVKEFVPGCFVKEITIAPRSKVKTFAVLDSVFLPDTDKKRLLVMFNSRIHLVADYVRERGIRNCTMLGYDKLERNLSALEDGSVSWIIAQHSDVQAANAVRTLAGYLAFKRPIEKKDNYSQMDILNKFNYKYYL